MAIDSIAAGRKRLAALTTEGVPSPLASPQASLASCRERQDELRDLKRRVLARIFSLRTAVREQVEKSRRPKPSLGELWERREEGARQLLADVGRRVTGLVDDDHADAIEEWSEIHREIDEHLDQLASLEQKLASAASEAPTAARLPQHRSEADRSDGSDDDLYAAVGAAVQKGTKDGVFCAHCRQLVEPQDRFCRRCGHRLAGRAEGS